MTGDTPRRVLGIGSAVVAMLALVLVVGPLVTPAPPHPTHPEARRAASPGPPIAAEAGVFATRPTDLAVAPGAEGGRASAKTRNLASFRTLRAYPGAPPRIPHEVRDEEFLGSQCGTCHAKGGFAARFNAYSPVTPHPEYSNCLQCHARPEAEGVFRRTDWRTTAWPAVRQIAYEGAPPRIPHGFQLRENCLACHGGPSAVSEVRTTHPERANCRQCHVPVHADPSTTPVFYRSVERGGDGGGGDR